MLREEGERPFDLSGGGSDELRGGECDCCCGGGCHFPVIASSLGVPLVVVGFWLGFGFIIYVGPNIFYHLICTW